MTMVHDAPLTRLHREAIADHALARLRARCGVRASRDEYDLLCLHVARGHAGVPAAHSDDGCPIYRLTIKGAETYAVFMPKAEVICTFLSGLRYRQIAQAIDGVSFGGVA